MSRAGHFGDWTVNGPALTDDDLRTLPEGTEVEIVWSGGNGPHRYVVVFDDRGEPYALQPGERPDGPMRYYNPLFDVAELPLTEVRRVGSSTGGDPE